MTTKVGMVSLGCSKNQVDAEVLVSLVVEHGYEISTDTAQCDAVIINTCGFIEDAKQESINTILEYCGRKGEGNLRVVVVTGCLAERYREDLAAEIPEIDVILGIGKNSDIARAIAKALGGERIIEAGEKNALPLDGKRMLTADTHSAYIKVADGCDNRCSYCAIPLIRGDFRSRKMESIIDEARDLIAKGVKEINLVAQDTTRYGEDLYGEIMLPELIERICELEGLVWLRLLYCYPQRVNDRLLDSMAAHPQVVPYIDMPVQHCNARILSAMNRTGDKKSLLALIKNIREKLPNAVLRTTLIAGFPGETDEEFEELCEFVQEAKFERLGCFSYSTEEDTPAATMEGMLPEEERRRRADIIMQTQMDVAFRAAEGTVGKTLEVLVEGQDENGDNMWGGRSFMDAPDIDTKVWFSTDDPINTGDMVMVRITGTEGYDLVGEV